LLVCFPYAQIHLWERERDRLVLVDGVAYSQFMSSSDFEIIRDFARERGISLWDSDQKKTLVVTKDSHEEVKRFWRKQSKS
jgi:transcription initiation factor TFIIH subunit 4